MDYTKENVEKCWMILNQSSNTEEKRQADNYLREFQKSPNCFDVCLSLFLSENMQNKIAAAFILYQIVRGRVLDLSENKDLFFKLKAMYFNQIIPNLKNSPTLVVQKVCFGASILILAGILTYWQEAIEDIMKFSKESEEKCYIAILILSNLNFEYSFIAVNQTFGYKIQDVFIGKKDIIFEFISSVLERINVMTDIERKKIVIEHLTEMTQSWIKFDVNILTVNKLSEKFINLINEENIDKISELICESVSNSKCAKLYDFFSYRDEEGYDIFKKVFDKINPIEINSIHGIIDMISNFIQNINKSSSVDPHDTLLIGMANIFASISENFIYLFFIKTDMSKSLLDLLLYFVSHKKRKISYKFFESICDMREFINSYYKFSNFSIEEKKEFVGYLLRMTECVMVNSKLRSLDVNYDLMLKKDILSLNIKNASFTHNNPNDIETDSNEVNVTDYRTSAEDFYDNIFLILVSNFGEDGVNIFLQKITSIFETANINDESILKDSNRLLAVETAFFVMRSITDSFEMLENVSPKSLLIFTEYILKSQIIKNSKIVINFLLFIDKASSYIASDIKVYSMTVLFLLNLSMENILEKISTLIVHNITMFSKQPNIELFNQIYNFYISHYDTFTDPDSTSNLSFALCCCLYNKDYSVKGNSNNIQLSQEELYKYYSLVMQPATERIKKLYSYLGENNAKVNIEILKNYRVHQNVLTKANEVGIDFFSSLFQSHFTSTFEVTTAIFNAFGANETDKGVVSEITKFYIKDAEYLKDKLLLFFDPLSKLMISSLEKSIMNYKSLIVLKYLCRQYAKQSIENNNNVATLFFNLGKTMTMSIIKERKSQIEMMTIYAEFFYYTFQDLNLTNISEENLSILMNIINLFIEGIKSINELELIKKIIKSFCSFIGNEYLNKEIINSKFTEMIFCAFNVSESFDSFATKELVNLVSYAMAFDKAKLLETIRMILKSQNFCMIFKSEYIDLIIEYLHFFGDNDSKLDRIVSIIVEIKQQKSQLSTLNFFGLEIARLKMQTKNKQ